MMRFALLVCVSSTLFGAGPVTGRWDLTVTPKNGGSSYPDWLELADAGGKSTLRVQPRSGGARQIPEFQVTGSRLHFVFSRADQKNPEVVWDVEASGDRINGTISRGGTGSQTAGRMVRARSDLQWQGPDGLGAHDAEQ